MSASFDQKRRVGDPIGKHVFERKEEKAEKYRRYSKIAIPDSYYMICIKKCFQEYGAPLQSGEKICLAKCVDRAHDYFALSAEQLDPFTNKI